MAKLVIKPPTHKVDALTGVFISPFDSAWDGVRIDRELAAMELAALAKMREEALVKAKASAGQELSEEEIEDVKASCVLSEAESQAAKSLHPWLRYLGGVTRYSLDAPDWDHEGKPVTARDYLKGKADIEFVIRRLGYRTYLECQDEVGHEKKLAFVRQGLKAIRSADYNWSAKGDDVAPDEVFEALHQTSLTLTGEIAVAVQRFNAPLSEDEKAALRKFAWQYDPDPDSSPDTSEYFSCKLLCKKVGGTLSNTERSARNCALPDFDTSTWTGKKLVKRYMGAPPCYSREGKDGDWNAPKERADQTGCPGSWYRTDFVDSVLRYYRKKDDNGGRIVNRAFDICEDPLVIEAVNTLETYEAQWRDTYHEKLNAKYNK